MGRKEDKVKEIREGLNVFLRSGDTEAGRALSMVREEYEKSVSDRFKQVPDQLKERIQSVNDAFLQLSRVKQVLKLAEHEENENSYALEQGRRLMKQNKYVEALRYFEHSMALGGENSEILLLAATAALYGQSYADASFYADQLLERDEQDYQALTLKGLVNSALGQSEEAHRYLSRAIKLRPGHPVILKYLKSIEEKAKIAAATRAPSTPKFKRRWKRGKAATTIFVNDCAEITIQGFRVVSLSGGGCLVEGEDLPEEFQFSFQLKSGKQIYGVAKVSYKLPKGRAGLKFERISPQDQEAIDREVQTMEAA